MAKIVHRTPQCLEVRDRPWLVPTFCAVFFACLLALLATRGATFTALEWFVTLAMVGITVVAGVVSGIGTTIRLDAAERRLHWRRSGAWPPARDAFTAPLDAIVRVGVQELPPGADTGPSWRVVVATRARTLPLSLVYTDIGDPEGLADEIRDWLAAAGVAPARDRAA